jgi:Tfp pilus assembly protein PilV
MKNPGGCTLVEVLIALVLFAVGVLGLAGSSAVVLRKLHIARSHIAAAAAVTSRMAVVASTGCNTSSGGQQQHSAGVGEVWALQPAGSKAVHTRVQVTFSQVQKVQNIEATLPCR